jgi:anaerobic magnesium-protoporphyrin IX monomethyl ester cyclase
MSKKIVFFFPSFASSEATAPLGILAVASPLLRAGYSVKLIDSTIKARRITSASPVRWYN